MSLLNVEHLTHGFGDRAIFDDVSFRLLKGEHIGLVGANGEGKSTFMNIVTGKLMPDEGKVEWSKNVHAGYLDQHAVLEKGMTIGGVLKSAFDPLLQKEQHRPPYAAAALAEAAGPELPAGRLGLRGRDVLRRDHHRLQPAAPAFGGQCGRGGLRRRGELRAGGDGYLQRRGPGRTAAGQQVLRQKRCRRYPQTSAAGQRNSACAGGGTVCSSVRVHRADRRGLQQ